MYSSYSFREVIKISDVSALKSRYPRTRIIPEYRFFKRNVPETNVRTHEDGVAPFREPARVMQITHSLAGRKVCTRISLLRSGQDSCGYSGGIQSGNAHDDISLA